MKRTIKIAVLIVLSIIMLIVITLGIMFIVFSQKVEFDKEKLNQQSLQIEFFGDKENILKEEVNFKTKYVKLDTLPSYIPASFVSTEDKRFYSHRGLDYKRMFKANLVNIKSRKLKQGGSTISQQLIKNTHLSNERTLERKIKEIILTKRMEKQLNKKEILENYLNCIYFGNNTYGIESASNYYFSKPAKELTVVECATLAGLISAPSKYNPIASSERCKRKRNVVLNNLYSNDVINEEEFNVYSKEEIKLNIKTSNKNNLNNYSENALDEAIKILNMPAKQIAIASYKIHTYYDEEKQKALTNALESINDSDTNKSYLGININVETGGICAYSGRSDYKLSNIKRQPGSIIKPLLVYYPALEENIISPSSLILDEEININGYKPKNHTNTYSGYVTARNAVSKSMNIPAVKVLSYVGVPKAKKYANKVGIDFTPSDNNYALALGGMTDGCSLKTLTNAYLPFANSGKLMEAKFIKYITNSDGKIVYYNKKIEKQIMRDDTAYLMTDMLKTCAKYGTSKKLSTLDYEIAAKTGTVGSNEGNTDAYNVSFTTKDMLGIWVGNLDNTKSKLSGSGEPTLVAKNFYKQLYKTNKPKGFIKPTSVNEIEIDMLDLKEKNKLTRANTFTPERYKTKEIFSRFNEPKELSSNFINLEPVEIRINDGKIIFEAKDYIEYELYENKDNKTKLVKEYANISGQQEYKDLRTDSNYYIVSKIKNFADNVEVISKKSNIIKIGNNKGNVSKVKEQWWI